MEHTNIVQAVEEYLKRYVTFSEDYFSFPAALWVIGTHCYNEFDVFPYLVITAGTMRAGKTTLKDLLIPVSRNGKSFSVDSPSSMFRSLEKDENSDKELDYPDMYIEEAEKLNAENHPAREFLNKGYQKGDVITKTIGEVKTFNCYCPKCFVLIGDVLKTLKDRAIPLVLRRRTPVEAAKSVRVRMSVKQAEAAELKQQIREEIQYRIEDIREHYGRFEPLSFLNERDELLFQPLFSLVAVLCPERMEEFTKVAVDVAMEKQAPSRRNIGNEWEIAEKAADDAEFRVILLRDMLTLYQNGETAISSNDALEKLLTIPTAPWRKFRGRGLTHMDMAFLLDSLNVGPKTIRKLGTSGTEGIRTPKATFRGYRLEHLQAAAKLVGLID